MLYRGKQSGFNYSNSSGREVGIQRKNDLKPPNNTIKMWNKL